MRLTKLDWLYLAWLSIGLFSSILNQNLHNALFGQYYRYSGLFFYLFGWFLSLYLRQHLNSKLVTKIIAISCLLASFGLLLGYLGNLLGLNIYQLISGRFAFTFGNPNFAGAFISLSAFFLPSFLLFIPALALLTTGSLSSASGFFYLLSAHFFPKNISNKIFIVILLAGFLYPLLLPVNSFDQKQKVWLYSFQAFLQKPLFGWGKENTATAIASILPDNEFQLKTVRIDKTHNLILEQLVETGLIGLILFLLICLNIYHQLAKNYPKYIPLFGAFILISQFNVINLTTWLFFFLLFSLAVQTKPSLSSA